MVADIVDLNQRRWDGAGKASDITPEQLLMEALRQLRAGEWQPYAISIIGVTKEDDDVNTDWFHAGKLDQNSRVGMLAIAQNALMS